MRGSIEGGLWGLVLGGVGLAFASVLAVSPMTDASPVAPQLETPQPIAAGPSADTLALFTSEPEITFSQNAPRVSAPTNENAAPVVDTSPVAPPPIPAVEPDLEVPQGISVPELASDFDAPAAPPQLGQAPAVPAADADVSVDTAPVVADTAAGIDADESDQAVATEAETLEVETSTVSETVLEAAPEVVEALEQDVASAAEIDAPETFVTEPDEETQEDAAVIIAEAEITPEAAAEQPVIAEETTQPDAAETSNETDTVETVLEVPASEASDDTTLAQATQTDLPATAPNVRVNRPVPAVTETADDDVVEAEVAPEPLPDDAPALLRFAASFESAGDVPLIAVLLVDEGSMSDAAPSVAELGFAPTVALNASRTDASSEMLAYRRAGAEVAMQITMPTGAQPSDVEIAFEAAFGLLPEVTMIFSDGSGVLVDDRDVTSQAMQILQSRGLGFVAVQQGFGSAVREAEQAEVPAATVLRQIDGDGTDQDEIARTLDQAAFRARQSGGAVLMGQVTPQTLAALKDWAAGLDQTQLRIAPVSAILLGASE